MLQISPCDSTFFLRLNTLSTAESRFKFALLETLEQLAKKQSAILVWSDKVYE